MMKRTLKNIGILAATVSMSLASCSLEPKLTENIDYSKTPISTKAELDACIIGAYSLVYK